MGVNTWNKVAEKANAAWAYLSVTPNRKAQAACNRKRQYTRQGKSGCVCLPSLMMIVAVPNLITEEVNR